MELVVIEKRLIAQDTVAVTLGAATGVLQVASPGAHITISLGELVRHYSLTRGFLAGEPYEIQVLRVAEGRGGSRWIHDRLSVGDRLHAIGVSNDFPLVPSSAPAVFIAGGIGITPFLSMASEVAQSSRALEIHHLVRHLARQVPLPQALLPHLHTYAGAIPDFARLLSKLDPASHIYVCGPVPMMSALRVQAQRLGFPSGHFHAETFGVALAADDPTLEVHLALSGTHFLATPGQPLLDALLAQGAWVGEECRRGQCGSCLVEVLEGEPIHRDALDPALRPGALCACVSWARGPKLVLKL
ncbi:MAG: oxidoreductase [Xanthomonadaceae bacterium]|nr:oxidoreductase [Xanthomonadaceae bacterium]